MSYYDFIELYWNKNHFSPKVLGEIVSGQNGLYFEKETIFRNAAHWMLVCKEIKSKNTEAHEFIIETLNLFLEHEPKSGSYFARNSAKDKSNGLIGSAWIVESLSEFSNPEYDLNINIPKITTKLLLRYPFDHKKGIWTKIVEPDGNLGNIDRTFNHQLWMCMAHYELLKHTFNEELQKRVNSFTKNLFKNLKLNRYGMVYHTLGIYPHYHRTMIKRLLNSKYRSDMNLKEWGYHGFNLLALAKIYNITNLEIFRITVVKLLKFVNDTFWEEQLNNKYGSTYNPVGIEIAVALDIIGEPIESVCAALNFHFNQCFDVESFTFINSPDKPTLNARLYELTFLSEKTKNSIYYNQYSNKWLIKL